MDDSTLSEEGRIPLKLEKLLSYFLQLVNKIANLLFQLCMLLIVTATAIIVYQVISRSVRGTAPIWINELATYLAIWAVYLLMGVLVWWDGHLKIEIVFEKLSERSRELFRYVQLLVIVFLSTEFMLHGYIFATVGGFRAQSLALGVDLFWVYVSTFIGGILLFIFSIAKMMELYLAEDYSQPYRMLPRGEDI